MNDWTPEQLVLVWTNGLIVLALCMLAFAVGYHWHRRQAIKSVQMKSGPNKGIRKSVGDIWLRHQGVAYRLIDVNHHGQLKSQASMCQPWDRKTERRGQQP